MDSRCSGWRSRGSAITWGCSARTRCHERTRGDPGAAELQARRLCAARRYVSSRRRGSLTAQRIPHPDPPVAISQTDALLDAQKQLLEMIVQGQPLSVVLDALCRVVEAQSERPVRAAILLVDPGGQCLRTGAAPSLPEAY